MNRPLKLHFLALTVFSLLGLTFSAISTYDFVAHLDRQVHAISCSFVPGLGSPDVAGTSGCHVVLMSPYSSLLRTQLWGGIPIALPAMAVFAYLVWRSAEVWLRREEEDLDETRFLLAATALPLAMSVIYLGISSLLVGAVCKLCVGVYLSSAGVFSSSLLAHLANRRRADADRTVGSPWVTYAIYFGEGVVFVLLPILAYLGLKPDYTAAMSQCGELQHPDDKYGVMVPLHSADGAVPAIELLDPLCPACKGFSQRLEASGLNERMKLDAILFPLDRECNWMVNESLHPGACAVSEAILCAGNQATEVVDWAFAHQEELRAAATQDQQQVYAKIREKFPTLAGCVGTPAVKTRLNKSLRWVVSNSLPVLTPQLYVRGQKVCDEDTDLGLEYVLNRMLGTEEKNR